MQYRFYLDGNLITENPIGWDAMLVRINRDAELKGVLVNLDATLTFTADGYDYLKGVFDSSDYCAVTTISIHRSIDEGANFVEKYTGLLFLSDMSFDDFRCAVTVKFTDDSFYGRIDKRRKTEAHLTGGATINGEALTPCLLRQVQYFDPATGSTIGPNGILKQPLGGYRVYEVLEYLISYMTDNEVEFSSPLFGTSGEFRNLLLTFGYSIRQAGNGVALSLSDIIEHQPGITFQKLFTELDHRFNIGFFVDLSGAKPKIIIDYWKKLFRANVVTTYPDLPNLKTEIAKDFIYSSVKFGGSKTYDAPAASFPETIRFLGFNSEQFAVVGKCNVENVLDLSYDFVSSSNVIEEILMLSGVDTSYDNDWFLIDATAGPGTELVATKSNWLTPATVPPYFYNERLTNYSIAKRYLGFVPDSIAAYLGNADNSIFVYNAAGQDLTGAFQHIAFQQESPAPYHDVNNLWDTAGSFYTVPLTGFYSVGININYQTHYPIELLIVAELRDTTDAFLLSETTLYHNFNVPADTLINIDVSALVVASATDLIKIKAYQTGNMFFSGARVYENAECLIDNIADGGGVYQTYNPADYPIINHIFDTETVQSQTDAITTEPLSQIEFYIDQTDIRDAWIDDIVIDEFKGTIKAKLLASRSAAGVEYPPELREVQMQGQLTDVPYYLSVTDYYEKPPGGSGTTVKTFFYPVGTEITVSIDSVFDGHAAGNVSGVTISIRKTFVSGAADQYVQASLPDLSLTFTVESGVNYYIVLGYDLATIGDTYPSLLPSTTSPTVLGGNGSAFVTLVSPSTLADYSFLWSTGATTQGITAPAGDYWVDVTYNPGGFTNNTVRFNIQIPISQTGA